MATYNKLIGSNDDGTELNNEYDISGSEDDDTEEHEVTAKGKKCHAKLMESIASLDKKKRHNIMERSEATGEVSEFNFSGRVGKSQDVMMHELMGSLANTPSNSELKKQLSHVQRNQKVLDTPLHKHEAEKVRRSVAYDAASKDVSKWDQVVQTNRKLEHQSFPLNQPVIGLQTTDEFVKKFKPSTPLEQEVYKMLHGSKHCERPNKELTLAEEEAIQSMSLEEAQERRAELQKTRALLSYYEAKCHRKKKIKSKKYHRIQRKSKSKEEAEILRERMKAGSEEAEELLINLDKARAKERVTLKHRNTGKWAKGMMRFGKYDQSAHSLLAEQLQKSHELTQKIAEVNNDDDNAGSTMRNNQVGGDEEYPVPKVSLSDINNPWFTGNTADKHLATNEHSKIATLQPVSGHVTPEESDNDSDVNIDDEIDELFEEDKCKKRSVMTNLMNADIIKKQDADEWKATNQDQALINETLAHGEHSEFDGNVESDGNGPRDSYPSGQNHTKAVVGRQETETSINLSKMLTRKATEVQSASPELIVSEDQAMGATQRHLLNIQEAFAEDDIVKVFQEEKQERIDRDKPKDVDLSLPGWGAWCGAGVKPSKKKINRFVTKMKPTQRRRDDNLQHVVINESRDKKIAVHQVNQLPFPFSTSEQFQRSVRSPIGSTWNTPSTVKQLTIPKVTTKLGAIIEPITAAEALKKSRKRKVETSQSEQQPEVAMNLPLRTEKQHTKRNNKDKRKKK